MTNPRTRLLSQRRLHTDRRKKLNSRERRRGRLWWRIGAGVIVVVSALAVVRSGPAASPLTARLTAATRASSTAGDSPAASVADQVTAATGGACPPNPTYPDSPTDQTQYGVPFTADILDGTVNVGYNEDSGGPGTKPLTNMPWFPWMLHVTGLSGTVSGCVPLPGLSLTVQPTNLHVNTYGYMQGPDNCSSSQNGCNLAPHSSATFSFTGIADPGQTNLPLFLTGDGINAAGATTLHYQTTPTSGPGLKVGIPTFTEEYPYPGTGPVTKVNLPAGSPPGASLNPDVYGGSVTVTNTTASTVTSITGEESAGFISGPSTLAPYGSPGDTGTYTFTFEGSSYGDLPDEQALPLTFSGEGASGLVDGSGVAYFTIPSLNVSSLAISAATINGQPALTAPGPQVPTGSVFKGTVTLTNNTSSTVTGIFGETGQAVQLLATVGPSGVQEPPLVLGGFSLTVSATKPLAATVVGARPDAFGRLTYRGTRLDGHRLGCGRLVGTESAASVRCAGLHDGDDRFLDGGARFAGGRSAPLRRAAVDGAGRTDRGASGGSNCSAGIQHLLAQDPPKSPHPATSQTCGVFGELFNWEIGGVEPDGDYYNCPNCTTYGQSGPVDAGAGPGEVQVEIDVMLTSVGALPVCRPSTTTPVACGGWVGEGAPTRAAVHAAMRSGAGTCSLIADALEEHVPCRARSLAQTCRAPVASLADHAEIERSAIPVSHLFVAAVW